MREDVKGIRFPCLDVCFLPFEYMGSIGHESKMLLQPSCCLPTEDVRLAHLIETGLPRFDCLMIQRIVLYFSMGDLS